MCARNAGSVASIHPYTGLAPTVGRAERDSIPYVLVAGGGFANRSE